MTAMIPNLRPPKATRSETEVFGLIKNAAGSESYFCLSSLGIARHDRKDYGEADFVIIGPAGVFCLEVKGGEIHRRMGTWEIGWPGKSYFSTEGPFRQAQGCRWPLAREIGRRLNCDFRKAAVVGWGVVFPDVEFSLADPEWSNEVVYDLRDKSRSFIEYVHRLEAFVRARLDHLGRLQPPRLSEARVREIVHSLRGDFDFVQSIRNQISDSGRELVALSAQQYQVLDLALNSKNRRLICDGRPGSGKTLIAVEAARRLAGEGRQILLLCYNRHLATALRRVLHDSTNVSVFGVHEFFESVILTAGLAEELRAAKLDPDRDALFFRHYPAIFERACEYLLDDDNLPQFDALVVDEGQDFLTAHVFNALGLAINGGITHGTWAIFLDSDFQANVFERMNSSVLRHLDTLASAYLTLADNFRNPRSVVREACAITGASRQNCRREFDAPVEYLTFSGSEGQVLKLSNTISQVLGEGVGPDQVTVLSLNKQTDSCAFMLSKTGQHRLKFLGEAADSAIPAITACSVSAFKGLENEVVILTDIPRLSTMTKWQRAVMYVAMTRARSRLFALVDKTFVTERYGENSPS